MATATKKEHGLGEGGEVVMRQLAGGGKWFAILF